jgi:hypothetical protein
MTVGMWILSLGERIRFGHFGVDEIGSLMGSSKVVEIVVGVDEYIRCLVGPAQYAEDFDDALSDIKMST